MDIPIQPIEKDEHGVLRFKENAIVRYLLDNGGIDLNQIACLDFCREDREQFAQLIGYSLGGFGELSYASDEVYNAAEKMAEGMDEKDAMTAAYINSEAAIKAWNTRAAKTPPREPG